MAAHALILVGMHRSGTSALMALCRDLGVTVGPEDQLLPPTPWQPQGYYEPKPVVQIHDRLLAQWGMAWDTDADRPAHWLSRQDTQTARDDLVAWVRSTFPPEARWWGVKDPRICRLVPLWQAVCDAVGATPHWLRITRDPTRIRSSLERIDALTGRTVPPGTDYDRLTARYDREADAALRGQDVLRVRQEELRRDPQGVARRIQAWRAHADCL